jgi:AraC-like DNA-binding protein
LVDESIGFLVEGRAPTWLQHGDVAMVIGNAWSFRSAPETPVLSLLEAWRDQQLPELGPRVEREGPVPFSWGLHPSAPCDRGLAIGMLVEDRAHMPVLSALPSQIVIRHGHASLQPAITAVLAFGEASALRPRAGYNAAARRLLNYLFIELVRAFLLDSPDAQTNWLRGVADERIGRAMHLMHTQPGQAWNRDRLAAACGMPGSTFSRRFRELVGRTPMDYLCSVRMHAAAEQLSRGEPVLRVVERAGYHSEWSFRRAFSQHFGMAPTQYAKAHRRPG